MIDYHVHSTYSGDSPTKLRDMCAKAVEIGIDEIVFTEHLDYTPTDISYGCLVYSKWMDEIAAAREEFSGRLTILSGVEVDYQEKYLPEIEDFLGSHELDFVLVSAHYVHGILLEEHEKYFPGKSEREAYLPYFEAALAAVETGFFDSLAHMDLCKRHGARYYGKFDLDRYLPQVEDILKALIRHDMALEVNTSGLRQAPGEIYPSLETLELYASLGGRKVTIGSDSHLVQHLGFGLSDGIKALKCAGIPEIARYRRRAEQVSAYSSPKIHAL
ncbi:MAG: histidinol-phosphatase [Armatimonadota bacterium]